MTNTIPLRPIIANVPEGCIPLPAHVFAAIRCRFCGETYSAETYEEYVEHWYATEYEGPVIESDGYYWNPQPETLERWTYFRYSCLG